MKASSLPTFLRLRSLLVLGLLAVVFVAMMLTSHAMAVLRLSVPQLSEAMSWLETIDLPFDMDHVAFFTAITFAARMLLQRLRWWWIVLAVAALAASTEVIQYWVPGRTPKLLDARDDLVGGGIGLLTGDAALWLVGFVSQWAGTRIRRTGAMAKWKRTDP